MLLLQIVAERKTADEELIKKVAGLDGDPDEVWRGGVGWGGG